MKDPIPKTKRPSQKQDEKDLGAELENDALVENDNDIWNGHEKENAEETGEDNPVSDESDDKSEFTKDGDNKYF